MPGAGSGRSGSSPGGSSNGHKSPRAPTFGAGFRTGSGNGAQGIAELANAAREQMQQLFGRPLANQAAPVQEAETTSPRASDAAASQLATAASSTPMTISPSNSLSEALQLDVEESPSLTFARAGSASGSAERPHDRPSSPLSVPHSGSGGGNIPEEPTAEADDAAPFGSPAAEGPGAVWDPPCSRAAGSIERSSGSMVDGLRQLLTQEEKLTQVLAERRSAMKKRTSAGLAAVEALGPGTTLALLAAAAAALVIGRGTQLAALLLWLLRDHGCDVLAGFCLSLVLLKALLAAHLDTRASAFVEGLDSMQASVKAVLVMGEDVRTMRHIIETMQADMEAKTAWIPTGMKPPTWLPGQKRSVQP